MFSTMDSQSQMDFLEVPLGLSANLFADDLDIDGSILDISLDEGLKKSNAANQSLEDLLTDSTEDPLGEEWMETLDLEPFLDSTDFTTTEDITPSKKVGADVLDISSLLNSAIAGEVKIEPRKEGMKASAFELLKALLTEQQPIKTDLSLDILRPAEVQSSNKLPVVKSPEAEVPMFDFSGCGSSENKDTQNVIFHTFEDLIQPEISLGNGDVVEISLTSELGNVITQAADVDDVSYICSPLSTEAESVLSSGPSSPFGYTEDFSTIDSNFLSSDEACSSSAKSSQVSDESFTKLKSKSKSKRSKAKASPYDSDYSVGTVTDKRQRKKMQNKNAATRYRVKKRNEKETLQEQEVRLSDKNHELKEKVESLQREIQYMKELMHEINKAKKSKI